MKKLSELQFSAKTRAWMAAAGFALMILNALIPDDSWLLSLRRLVISLAALVLILLPGCKPMVRDELYLENFAKASSLTLSLVLVCLLLTGILTDCLGNLTISIHHDMWMIGFGAIACLQNILLAVFESRGASADEEDA